MKYTYDIALEEGVGPHLVAWSCGLMVFFVTLALAVNFALTSLTDAWSSGLAGSVTVEIKPPAPGEAAQARAQDSGVQKILALENKHPAIKSTRLVDKAEIRRLVQPWLAGGQLPDDMPLPTLIDIDLAKGADTGRLTRDIKAILPAAVVDTHADLAENIKSLVTTSRVFVLVLTGVIAAAAAVAISGVVRAKFSIHEKEVETIHLLGASDEYIARQFRTHTLRDAFQGACVGFAAMIVLLLALGYATRSIDAAILPRLKLLPWQWLALAVSPVFLGSLVAHLTAQKAVMRELARMP